MIEHISEQELLLAFDGELRSDRSDAVRSHTRECAICEERWTNLEQLSQQVTSLQCPEVDFQPREAAVAKLVSSMDSAPRQNRRHWTAHTLAWANTLVAVAVAITCIVLLPSLRVAKTVPSHTSAAYEVEQTLPSGYVSLPYADPALPLDDTEVLPVVLSADDLELMGLSSNSSGNDTPQDGVNAEILIGMDGWPRAIRILE